MSSLVKIRPVITEILLILTSYFKFQIFRLLAYLDFQVIEGILPLKQSLDRGAEIRTQSLDRGETEILTQSLDRRGHKYKHNLQIGVGDGITNTILI